MITTAGNQGDGVRSDCFISLEITSNGGISIDLKSKVKALYGHSILESCSSILNFFEIPHARLEIIDSGALPFTIAARLEAAIKKQIHTGREYLLPIREQNNYTTSPDTERVTRLYLPGNNPKLMINAGIYGSHGIILDLEDAVAPDMKFEARFLVRNALRSVDFYGAERMVRINQIPEGLEDLKYCVGHSVNLILIPKCETGDHVRETDKRISELAGTANTVIHLMPIIESALGVLNAYEIAKASERVVALAIGLEDYTADIGVQRSTEGKESWVARSMVINAAVAAGTQPIDSVFSDIDDMETLANYAIESRSMGFTGMGCIHPRQVPVINRSFMPTTAEIEKAKKIVRAFLRAREEGSAVVAMDSKMIDAPVVKKAIKTIDKAIQSGILHENWREDHEQQG